MNHGLTIGLSQRWLLASMIAVATLGATVARADAGDDALGRERIERFDVRVFIGRTGCLEVVETIRVVARGERIIHGIHREIDSRDVGQGGLWLGTTYAILSVTRDGLSEPFEANHQYLGISVRIGDARRTLDPGVHEYRIRYRTSRRIEEVAHLPTLTWNVTGALWPFPIEHASVVVRTASRQLPRRYATVGPAHVPLLTSTSRDARSGRFRSETLSPLAPGESFTLRVELPGRAVAPQTLGARLREAVRWRDFDAIALGGLLLLVAGLTLAYLGSARGVSLPGAPPPEGQPADLSAGKACGLHRFTFDGRVFTAGVLELVERGFAVLETKDDAFVLSMSGKTAADCAFLIEEADLARALFGEAPTLVLDETSRATLTRASSQYRRDVEVFLVPAYIEDGVAAIRLGSYWVVATFLATALASPEPTRAGIVLVNMFVLGGWTLLIDSAIRDRGIPGANASRLGVIFLAGVPTLTLTWATWLTVSPITAVALLASFVVLSVFDGLLESMTALGKSTRAELEAFGARLRSERSGQVGITAEPPGSAHTVGRFTSYAFALGIDDTNGQSSLATRLHETLEELCRPPGSGSGRGRQFGGVRSRGGGGGGGGRSGGGGW